jgi:hypothetical protein
LLGFISMLGNVRAMLLMVGSAVSSPSLLIVAKLTDGADRGLKPSISTVLCK